MFGDLKTAALPLLLLATTLATGPFWSGTSNFDEPGTGSEAVEATVTTAVRGTLEEDAAAAFVAIVAAFEGLRILDKSPRGDAAAAFTLLSVNEKPRISLSRGSCALAVDDDKLTRLQYNFFSC